MAHDSQIVRAKENLKLYVRDIIESEAWLTVVQLKRKP